MGFMSSDSSAQQSLMSGPTAPKPVEPLKEPTTTKPKRKSMQTTFLGEEATPMGAFEGKTLLGQ